MNADRSTLGPAFWLKLVLATLFWVVAGFVVFFVSMSLLGERTNPIPVLVAGLTMTICFGTVIGLAQAAILRRYEQRPGVWIGLTLLGFLISSPALLSMSGGFGPYISFPAIISMTAVLGCALGVSQWLGLRGKVGRSALWIGISLIGWVIAGLVGMALKSLSWQMGPILYWLGLFFFGTLLSAAGMVWLLNRGTAPTADNRPDMGSAA